MEIEVQSENFTKHRSKKHGLRKILATICSAAVMLTAVPLASLTTFAQTDITAVTLEKLNLRKGAGMNYDVVEVLTQNAPLTVLDRSEYDWVKVRTASGKTGYCHSGHLDITTDCVTTAYLNFRSLPNTNSSVLRTFVPDTKLDIIRFNGSSWAKVKASDGTAGYICTDYVNFVAGSNPTPAPTPVNTELTLSQTSKSLPVGKSFTLSATGNQGTVTFATSNGSIATVTSKGVVKGIAAGTAKITAIDSKTKKTASCTVKVVKTDFADLTISPTSKDLTVGESFTVKPTTTPSGKTVYYKSSNTSVATVDSQGKVKSVKAGSTTITVSDSTGVISKTCKVTVSAKAKISISSTASVYQGSSVSINITKEPSNLAVKWTSSNNSVASVNNGKVSGISPGTATITASDATGSVKSTCKVTVYGVSMGNVRLSRYATSATAGKTIYIVGYNGNYWGSSDNTIATVKNGMIETKKPGTVAITFSDSYGNKAVCSVTVSDAAPVKFAYSSPNSAVLKSLVTLVAITDKIRDDVYFRVTGNGVDTNILATSKTSEGNTYIWKANFVPQKAGVYSVQAYGKNDKAWRTCDDGKCDIFVSNKTSTSQTGLSKLRASDGVIGMIGTMEGFVSDITYDYMAGYLPTLGHGCVVWEGQRFYDHLTRGEAYALLVKTINSEAFTSRVNEMLIQNSARFNQQQFDSLVCFSYNLGTGWTYGSDLKTIILNSYGYSSSSSDTVTGSVNVDGLNLRKAATTSSDVIEVLGYNDQVTLYSTQKYNGVWYKVKTADGKTGYCSGTYLTLSSATSGTVRDLTYVNRNALINEMLSYHHAGGVCYWGLLYRRADELEIYLYNDYIVDGRRNKYGFPNPSCISW